MFGGVFSGHGQVPHLGYAGGGVPNFVVFASAVLQDAPSLHVGEGALKVGSDNASGRR